VTDYDLLNSPIDSASDESSFVPIAASVTSSQATKRLLWPKATRRVAPTRFGNKDGTQGASSLRSASAVLSS
jgi:hypothetical protein